jgi:hypothetical protein
VVILTELALIFMILLVVYPNGAVASGAPASEPAALSLSGSVSAGSAMQYPYHYYYNYPYYPYNYTYYYSYYSYPYYYPYAYDSSYCYTYYYDYYGYNYDYYPYFYYGAYGYPYNYPQSCYPTTTTTSTPPATPTYALQVATNPSSITSVSGNGTYNQGTAVSFSVASLIIPKTASQRYVFTGWSGDFSGSSPSGTLTMTSAKSVVANYQLQNYLKVSLDPQGITTAAGEGWYVPTDSVTAGPVPSSIPGGDGTRYVFQQWTIDNAPVSGNSVQITMNNPHTLVAHYKTQYMLTVLSEYGIAQGTGWYDAGTSTPFSVTTQVDTSYGVKQVFDRWTGDTQSTSAATAITMDSPHTVRAIWRTDSTVLYTTIAVGIAAAFVLGIGLAIFGFMRMRGTKSAPTAQPTTPVTTAQPAPEKLKATPTKKKTKEVSTGTEGKAPSSEV